jgi:hypothetical protein
MLARIPRFSPGPQATAKSSQPNGSGYRETVPEWKVFFSNHARYAMLAMAALLVPTSIIRADEQLFGFVRGAETLPAKRSEVYQFITVRSGKTEGTYVGSDFETEYEYGFTDRFQASISLEQHYFYNKNVTGDRDALDDCNSYRFGGGALSAKYRVLSPFKDPIGLALRLEGGYLINDEVDGLPQHERYLKPEIDFQKDFLDDTLICAVNFGAEWAWGKQPAEEYPREFSYEAAAAVAYRFAPNWFAGLETHMRAEYPRFDLYFFEHRVFFAGPSLHYSQKDWWATLIWNYQIGGKGVGEPADGMTFAEEARHVFRLKVGFNF